MRQQQSIHHARTSAIAAAVVFFSMSASGQAGQSPASSTAPAPVQGGETVRRLSVDDAVKIALEQNLGIQIQRVEPQISDETVAQARAAWLPNLTSTFNKNSNTFQSTNSLSGTSPTVNNALFSGGAGINQVLPWGGSYTASWGSSHSTTSYPPSVWRSIRIVPSFASTFLANVALGIPSSSATVIGSVPV